VPTGRAQQIDDSTDAFDPPRAGGESGPLFAKQKGKELGQQMRLIVSLIPREAEAAGETYRTMLGVPAKFRRRADKPTAA
jgi:hypothetical protein